MSTAKLNVWKQNFNDEAILAACANLNTQLETIEEMKKLKALGATMPKSQKVPISILRGMKAHLDKKNAR